MSLKNFDIRKFIDIQLKIIIIICRLFNKAVYGGFILSIILMLNTCKKINYYPDKNTYPVKTKFLAHRGCGTSDIQENTLEAVKYGISRLNGVEIDIQLSKDRTIWLAHNVELESCGGKVYDCFPETYDNNGEAYHDQYPCGILQPA